MITLLMILYVVLALFLALFILIQPGKGDMGLGGMGNQMLFGGSGGQNFFEKTTWTLCVIFIFGALGLALLKTKEVSDSQLKGFKTSKAVAAIPFKTQPPSSSTQAPRPTNLPTKTELPPLDQDATDNATENQEDSKTEA